MGFQVCHLREGNSKLAWWRRKVPLGQRCSVPWRAQRSFFQWQRSTKTFISFLFFFYDESKAYFLSISNEGSHSRVLLLEHREKLDVAVSGSTLSSCHWVTMAIRMIRRRFAASTWQGSTFSTTSKGRGFFVCSEYRRKIIRSLICWEISGLGDIDPVYATL